LAQARAVGSPGKALPSSASSSSFLIQQQQSATIASLQEERTELRRTLSQLQGQISNLEEGRAQDKVCVGGKDGSSITCIVGEVMPLSILALFPGLTQIYLAAVR